MRQKAEKAASDLAETLKREKTSRVTMSDLQERLSRQRRLVARIDRRLGRLSGDLDRTETEVRRLEDEDSRTRARLASAVEAMFLATRDRGAAPLTFGSREERLRFFTRLVLVDQWARSAHIAADKEKTVERLSGLERTIEASERKMREEKRVGETLASRREAERRNLLEIERQKRKKEEEVRSLKARIARMESLVTRIEGRMRRKEEKGRSAATTGRAGPAKFSGVPGGLASPVDGKVVGRFGKQRDPVFDVTVESRGVEIECPAGSVIRAVGKGDVVFVGAVPGFGKVLILQHGSGLFSVYGKAESFAVKAGAAVAKGDGVGRLPASPAGKSVLYLELRAAGTAIDPASVIPLSR